MKTLFILNDGFFGAWTQIDGTAEIVALPEALDGLKALYRAVAGEHKDWADFEAAMARERRVLLLIDVT